MIVNFTKIELTEFFNSRIPNVYLVKYNFQEYSGLICPIIHASPLTEVTEEKEGYWPRYKYYADFSVKLPEGCEHGVFVLKMAHNPDDTKGCRYFKVIYTCEEVSRILKYE